jgi:isopentenyldiphosphate isomerase
MKAETWDVYDRKGRRTGRTQPRGMTLAPGDYHLLAEVWIFNSRGRILISRRADTRTLLPGMWTLTTGCMVAGEDSAAGILREAAEELGVALDTTRLWRLCRITREHAHWDVYTARWDGELSALRLQPEEVSDARWVTPDTLRAMLADGTAHGYPEIHEILRAVEARMADESSYSK